MDITTILKEHFKENMTDEISATIQTAFELAISEKVAEEKTKLEEKLELEMKEKVEAGLIELEEKLDTYISKANDELIEENLKDVESKLKVELAEKLIGGVLTAIKENNMEIAVEDKDVIKQLEEENAKIEASLNEAVENIGKTQKEIFEYKKAIAVMSMTENLTETQKEKVSSMVEHVSVKDIEDFKTKVGSAIEIISEKKDDKKSDDINLDEKFEQKKESELSEFIPKWIDKN